ncbi:Lon protease family protein [Caldovatus aquaticus]|uniref:endopeptidase La n=1 Tax=Caldovatus aquaticus TaxID=2865671 RepID=A0ABS7F0Y0_9PROT|nr:ATP-binding protein [Caldovatus aquaticus]MBW8269285.1 AAA family ATPase [Caldovatus aquaticus]
MDATDPQVSGQPAEAPPAALPAERLYRPADLSALAFTTTAELEPLQGLAGQARAREAVRLGTQIAADGFNIFAVGPGAARVGEALRELLREAAARRPAPPDWVYVNNFAVPHRPVALALPAGRAPALRAALSGLIDELRAALPALFESEDYQRRRSAIEASFQGEAERRFAALGEKAAAKGVAILRTPMGFAVAPAREGKVVPPDEFAAWPPERQAEMRAAIEEIEKDLEETLRGIPRIEKERRDAVRALDRETAKLAIDQAIEEAKAPFADLPRVLEHLEAVRADLLDHAPLFLEAQALPPDGGMPVGLPAGPRSMSPFDRYDVNVLVTRPAEAGAPVIEELHPTLGNLVGRVEHIPVQGALITNFRLIKPGSLHRANGGTILIDARALLMEPFSWAALKRALLQRRITIEDVAQHIGLTSTVSLEPDPIPLDVKVVLVGERLLHYLLAALDPDLDRHFKIVADFDDEAARSPESEAMLARMIGTIAREEGLRPLDRGAAARAVEHAARLAEDAERLTLLTERLRDLVVEADHWAGLAGRAAIAREDVERTIAEQRRRLARVHELAREAILRDIALIATTGSRVGQVNGLSVITIGGQAFGRPTRITARVRPGSGRIVDIEREVALGGPLHAKGVLILTGFLSGRYALDAPMSLYASLVFEQSYGGVEGDSASCAELLALLSALSGLPLRQDLAVTGSVNQHGDVQAIGGVNEKIEGFFEVCRARGLTGTQGVVIPHANVQHLMLHADVVEACAAGRFAIYPVRRIDEAAALLTGRPAGVRGPDGAYPEGSVNRLVEERLRRFAAARRAMHEGAAAEAGPEEGGS